MTRVSFGVPSAFLASSVPNPAGGEWGGGEEGAETGTGCRRPLGQIALRNQLQLDLAAPVEIVKDPGVGLPGKAADDLAHTARLEQCGDAHIAIARVVVHDSQLACTLLDETVNQLGGDAGG